LGPSNNWGPGSLWHATSDRDFNPVWPLSALTKDPAPLGAVVPPGNPTSCVGKTTKTSSVKPSAVLESKLAPASGSLSADLDRARTITLSVSGWQWDFVAEGPFNQAVSAAAHAGAPYATDVSKPARVVMTKALLVKGMSADLEFSSSDAAQLKAKYSGNLGALSGSDISVGFDGKWTSATTLNIATAGSFYLVGKMAPLVSGGFAAGGPRFGQPVAVQPDARVGVFH
jgi:hypothetical protein